MDVGILITGNEVLSAKTRDTNGPFIGMYLRKIGVPVRASMMCADNETDLLDCLNYLSERCDVVLMTGGLGPTSDDLTSEIVAKFFSVKTVFYNEAWDNCLQAYKKFNRLYVPESNKKQAFLPDGSSIIANKIGTAVGFKVTGKKGSKMATVYCLPGVPYEMEPMFLNEVYPDFLSTNFSPITKTWQVFLIGESAMQSAINAAEKSLQQQFPTGAISYQAHPCFVTYSIALFPNSHEESLAQKNFLENKFIPEVEKAFHKHILYSQEKALDQYLVESLLQKNCTVAFLEGSCGGALSKELSVAQNFEKVYRGSLILPTNNSFSEVLNIFQQEIQSGKMQADICITEWGSPALELATNNNPHGHFYIQVAINKQKIKDERSLVEKLTSFEWKEILTSDEKMHFISELNVSTRYEKGTQQMRVSLYCLCSLALVVEYL